MMYFIASQAVYRLVVGREEVWWILTIYEKIPFNCFILKQMKISDLAD